MAEKVSIVIPCFNEEKYIENCIDSFLHHDYPQELTEIIIIDGGCTDGTISIINNFQKKFTNIKILSNPERITPVSLNIGIKNATGFYILIASAHSMFPADYISILVAKLEEMNCDGIGGGIDTKVKNSTPVSEAIIKVLGSPFGVGNSKFRTSNNEIIYVDTVPFGIYKKSLFSELGNYNEKLVRNHDIEFSKRMLSKGKKIVLVSSIRCTYYARETYGTFAQNAYKNGIWNILTLYITGRFRSLSIRHFIPLIFLLSVFLPLVFALLISKYFVLISIISLLTYSGFIFFVSRGLIDDSNTRFLNVVLSFVVLHFSYAFGSFIGLFRIDKICSSK